MILVDTSVWIEFFKGKEPYSFQLVNLMENQNIIVNELVFAELIQGAKGKRERDVLMRYWEALPHAEKENLYVDSALFSSKKKHIDKGVGLVDSVLVHVVKTMNVKLWTLDKKLSRLLAPNELFDCI